MSELATDSPTTSAPGPARGAGWVGRHTWAAVLVVGGALYLGDERSLLTTQNPNLVPSVILLGAAVVPLAFVAFVFGRRLPFDVPSGAVWATGLLSGLVGTVVAATLEFRTLHRLGTVPMLFVGLIEEAAKLLVPLAVLLLLRYRRPADGLLLGVASGAGFAALETMGYAFVTLLKSQGSLPAVTNLLLLRGLLSPAGHMAWTGITAAALWRAADAGWTGRALARALGIFVVVVLLHAAWDGIGTLPAYVAIGVGSLLLLGLVAHRLGPQHAPGSGHAGAPPLAA
jgi:RsiW-degrading membrane proteinase PrsW (M82 family)